MTKDIISQYCYLEQEVQRIDELMQEIDRKSHRGSIEETEFIRKQHQKLTERKGKSLKLREEIYDYVDSIDDCLVRMILFERYIKGKTWTAVAHIVGGGNTHDGVRKIAERFLRAQSDN